MLNVEKCLFVNRAPFKDSLEISFKDGINVLCGINGRGKTTILSYIVDAFYEMARPNYSGSFEGIEDKYYRISSSAHTIDSSKPSIVYIRFNLDNKKIDYIDVRGTLTEESYNLLVKYDDKINYQKIKSDLKRSATIKLCSCDDKKDIKEAFQRYVITYFPSYRYELPGYLNTPYKSEVEISNDMRFANELPNPIEVCTGLNEFSTWVLDIVLDWEVNKKTQKVSGQNGTMYEIDVTPECGIWDNLSDIMKGILSSKKYPGRVRFGIGRRSNSGNRISVMHDSPTGISEQICPNLSLLSSGETALMCLFGEIIRQADRLKNNISLHQIQGIVLIDEIEKHLHIRLQKEILPKLLHLFPKVQFIVSSHSPFLNMGLADNSPERTHILDLDNGGLITTPTNNEVYQNTYELFLGERNKFAAALAEIRPKIESLTKTLVITEGKTDWKHFKKALDYFKSQGEFFDLDIELYEYEMFFGDSELNTTLTKYSRIPNRFKIIGLFDCDEGNGRSIYKEGGTRNYGNNVYGMSIPIPDHRSYNDSGISVEFLYKDEDLKKVDSNNRRLYVTSEFNENGRYKADSTIGVRNSDTVKKYIDVSKEKIYDHDVIDINGNSLALSKENFAANVLNTVPPFDNMDFSGFRAVFDRLRNIIAL